MSKKNNETISKTAKASPKPPNKPKPISKKITIESQKKRLLLIEKMRNDHVNHDIKLLTAVAKTTPEFKKFFNGSKPSPALEQAIKHLAQKNVSPIDPNNPSGPMIDLIFRINIPNSTIAHEAEIILDTPDLRNKVLSTLQALIPFYAPGRNYNLTQINFDSGKGIIEWTEEDAVNSQTIQLWDPMKTWEIIGKAKIANDESGSKELRKMNEDFARGKLRGEELYNWLKQEQNVDRSIEIISSILPNQSKLLDRIKEITKLFFMANKNLDKTHAAKITKASNEMFTDLTKLKELLNEKSTTYSQLYDTEKAMIGNFLKGTTELLEAVSMRYAGF